MLDSIRSSPRRRWLVGGGVVLGWTLFVGFVVVSVLGGYPPPCDDDLAPDIPQAAFAIGHDTTTDEVVVRHTKGESFRSESTEALIVVVEASDSDSRTAYTLANRSAEFPFSAGDQSTVEDVTVSGRPLMAGDEIYLVRYGSELSLPAYCPNSRSAERFRTTLGTHVVQ